MLFYEAALLVVRFQSNDVRKYFIYGQTISAQNWKKNNTSKCWYPTVQLMIRQSSLFIVEHAFIS